MSNFLKSRLPPLPGHLASYASMTCAAYALIWGSVATVSAASFRDKPELFFRPGPTAPETQSVNALYPRGRLFPISFASLETGMDKETVAECIRLGVVLAKQGPKIAATVGQERDPITHQLSVAETLDEELAAKVKKLSRDEATAIWVLSPGEIERTNPQEMEYLRTASRIIHRNDPQKRPLFSYNPPGAITQALSHIAPWVDYLGKGGGGPRAAAGWNVERATEAIHETTAEATPVVVPMPLDLSSPKEVATAARHDLYLGLINGARGIITHSGRHTPSPEAEAAFRTACLQVARELLGPLKLGEVFLFGEVREQLEVDIVDGPSEIEWEFPEARTKGNTPAVSHLDLVYGKDRFLVLVNSAPEPVTLMVGGMPYAAVNAESLFDKDPPVEVAEGEFELDLQPLEVKIYRMTRR